MQIIDLTNPAQRQGLLDACETYRPQLEARGITFPIDIEDDEKLIATIHALQEILTGSHTEVKVAKKSEQSQE